jgi:YHS domain-containing protein
MKQVTLVGAMVAVSLLVGTAWAGEMKPMTKTSGHEMKSMTAPSVTTTAKNEKDEMVVCPVLKEKIKKSAASDSVVYKGTTYYFCCAGCKPEFMKNPEKYISKTAQAKPAK